MQKMDMCVELDGRKVLIDQSAQEVRILDEDGRIVLHERIQVAAASLRGLFSVLEDTSKLSGISDPHVAG